MPREELSKGHNQEQKRETGTVVKVINNTKHFGFVEIDGTKERVYVNIAAVLARGVVDSIEEGDRFSFVAKAGKGEKRTIWNLRRIDVAPPLAVVGGLDHAPRDPHPKPKRKKESSRLSGDIISVGLTGMVKWFNATEGFGFIAPDESLPNGKDVFVHISAVERAGLSGLCEDQRVTFDLQKARDGRVVATNLGLL